MATLSVRWGSLGRSVDHHIWLNAATFPNRCERARTPAQIRQAGGHWFEPSTAHENTCKNRVCVVRLDEDVSLDGNAWGSIGRGISTIGFSLLGAGLTALAFSIGSFLLAPVAVPLAQRYGRLVLSAGGLLMAIGTVAVVLGADGVGQGSVPWSIIPGLLVTGVGLSS
jgi:hypothetical protein